MGIFFRLMNVQASSHLFIWNNIYLPVMYSATDPNSELECNLESNSHVRPGPVI